MPDVMKQVILSTFTGVLLITAGHPEADASSLTEPTQPTEVTQPERRTASEMTASGTDMTASGTDMTASGETAGTSYEVSSAEELSALRKKLKAGDTVIWKNGTYRDAGARLYGEGTENAPITLKAETPGGVIFTGASSLSLNGSHLVAEGFCWKELDTSVKSSIMSFSKTSSDCRFSDCMIDGAKSRASETDSKWVSFYGERNIVEHCTFSDKRNMGCLMVVWFEEGKVPGHIIRNNFFSRPYTHYDDKGKARNGQEAIRIGTSDVSMSEGGCLVTGNHFFRCNGERAEIISNKSCGNTYSGNLFEECDGTLTLRHGNRCTVRGNCFISGRKPDSGGIRIIGEDHLVEGNVISGATGTGYKSAICLVRGESEAELSGYWTVKNPVIRDNVLIDCRCGITINCSGRKSQDRHPENALFENNVIVSHKGYMMPVCVIATPDDAMTWKGNVIFGGKCSGISLPAAAQEPELPDYGKEREAIRANAGVRW